MNGIINDIKRFAVHDGPGIRVTVFFKGCPLRCAWCHNPESMDLFPVKTTKQIIIDGCVINETEITGREQSTEEIMAALEREAIFMEKSQGGVTFSGGEPMLQIDFLEELLSECKKCGYHTAIDTSGYVKWTRFERILDKTDLFLYDLKHTDSKKHESFTGVKNGLILENLKLLSEKRKRIFIRVPVIPGFNNSLAEQEEIASCIKNLNGSIEKVDLLPFHAIAAHKYKRFNINNRMAKIPSLHKEEIKEIEKIYKKHNLKTTIGG